MRFFLILVIMSCGSLFAAQPVSKFLCQKGAEKRGVEVVYVNPEAELPCKVVQHYHLGDEVNYKKVDKFWAKNTRGYCQEKAEWLAMKRLQSLAWKCKRVKILR